MPTKIPGGLAVDEFLERETGGVYHKAILLADLGSALYGAHEEWRYHERDGPQYAVEAELVRLCEPLVEFLDRVSILPDGSLTLHRQCRRCGGATYTPGERPCIECGGVGSVHADEADG